MNIAIGNDASNGICILTPVSDSLTVAADKYFGAGNYDEEDESVLSSLDKSYFPAYSWNLTTHTLDVDMIKARTRRMDAFKKMRCRIWCDDGLPENPADELINLFTGNDKIYLESMRDMEANEQSILDTKNTIQELEDYTPGYLAPQ